VPLVIVGNMGDFDGDTAIGYFPISKEAMEDLKKFTLEDHIRHFITEKDLKGFRILPTLRQNDMSIRRWYKHNTGISETKKDLVARYGEAKAANFNKLYNAEYSPEELFDMQKDAAGEFSYMKSGTANAGNIGNLLRNLMYKEHGKTGIKVANHVYHVLAQAALDCKNSLTDRAKLDTAFMAFRSYKMDKPTFVEALSPYFKDIIIDTLWKVLTKNGRWQGNITSVIARNMPIAHIVNAGKVSDLYLAALNTKLGKKEGSFVEYLTEFIHPRNDLMIKKTLTKEEDIVILSTDDEP